MKLITANLIYRGSYRHSPKYDIVSIKGIQFGCRYDACKYSFLKSLIDLIVSAAHVLLLSSEYLELLLYSLSLFLSMYVRMLASCCFTNSFKACHNFENFFVFRDGNVAKSRSCVTFMEWSMMKG